MKELQEKIQLSLIQLTQAIEEKIATDFLEEGSHNDLACYYKLPMFFLEMGQFAQAQTILNFIYKKFLMENGDFKSHPQLKSVKPEYCEYWSYFNGWILRASHLLEQKIPQVALDYFKLFSLGNGRYFSHHPDEIHKGTTDILTVAHHGLFYLESGAHDLCAQAAKFLCIAHDAQQELDRRFLLRFSPENLPIVDFEEGQRLFFMVEKNREPEQLYFMMAYPCAFLVLYYRKTGDSTILEYAKRYMHFLLTCHEQSHLSRFSHKTAWAASLLFAETRDSNYLNVIQPIVENFLSIQCQEGLWFKEENLAVSMDQSAEIGCWFSQILKNIQSPRLQNDLQRVSFRLFGSLSEPDALVGAQKPVSQYRA